MLSPFKWLLNGKLSPSSEFMHCHKNLSFKIYFQSYQCFIGMWKAATSEALCILYQPVSAQRVMHRHPLAMVPRVSCAYITKCSISDTQMQLLMQTHLFLYESPRKGQGSLLRDLSHGLSMSRASKSAERPNLPCFFPLTSGNIWLAQGTLLGRDWCSYRSHQIVEERLSFHSWNRFLWKTTICHVKFVHLLFSFPFQLETLLNAELLSEGYLYNLQSLIPSQTHTVCNTTCVKHHEVLLHQQLPSQSPLGLPFVSMFEICFNLKQEFILCQLFLCKWWWLSKVTSRLANL